MTGLPAFPTPMAAVKALVPANGDLLGIAPAEIQRSALLVQRRRW
jgi:hypothetical protein